MTQIKRNQIIPDLNNRSNPLSSLPRDLYRDLGTNSGFDNSTFNNLVPTSQEQTQLVIDPSSSGENTNPDTPYILSVKSQTVNFSTDGKATIDVILLVTDIKNAKEYEVRIAKNDGNL